MRIIRTVIAHVGGRQEERGKGSKRKGEGHSYFLNNFLWIIKQGNDLKAIFRFSIFLLT